MEYFFTSPTLDTLGFTSVEDHVSQLVAEADAHDIEVYADIQGLAYVGLRPGEYPAISPVGSDHVAAVVRELAAYGVDGVSEEMFLADWYLPTYQACLDSGITYIHKAISWDFGAMSHTWNTSVFDVYPHCSLIMTEDYEMATEPAMIAGLEQIPSIAGWLNNVYGFRRSE